MRRFWNNLENPSGKFVGGSENFLPIALFIHNTINKIVNSTALARVKCLYWMREAGSALPRACAAPAGALAGP